MKSLLTFLFIGVLGLAAACALTPTPLALAPVGPNPHGPVKPVETGYLIVDSAAKTYGYDRQAYIEHTAYGIYEPNGQRLRSVQNATSFHGPDPVSVPLSPGDYDIVAWAEGFQLVRVPVVIKAGRVTEVNLQTGHQPAMMGTNESNLVRMADGRIVGWSAEIAPSH